MERLCIIGTSLIAQKENIDVSTLRQLRDEADLTVFALASLAQVSISTVNRMESGTQGVTKRLANQVLQTLSERLGRKITIEDVENLKIVSISRK